MAGSDVMANIGRGCMKYYYYAVENSLVLASAGQFTSTANSAFILVPLETAAIEADSALTDYDDLAALIAGASNEQTTMGRKTLTDADLAAVPAPDDTNSRLDLDFPDVTWTAPTGNAVGKIAVCFDPDTTGGTDSSLIPVFFIACSITPDGNDVVLVINAAGIYRSS